MLHCDASSNTLRLFLHVNSVDVVFTDNIFLQDHALTLTINVLLSIKSSQIDQAVEALEQNDLLDVLMKYIYRGFEIPSEGSSGHLLQWHEKVFAKGGVGCIVRVLSDRNRA